MKISLSEPIRSGLVSNFRRTPTNSTFVEVFLVYEHRNMSTNIDHVEEVKLKAWMTAKHVRACLSKYEVASCNFLEDMEEAADKAYEEKDKERLIPLPNFAWCSERSGNSFDDLVRKVCKKIKGHVIAIFTWEGGEFVTGLEVKDGITTECDVHQVVVPPIKEGEDNLYTKEGIREAIRF